MATTSLPSKDAGTSAPDRRNAGRFPAGKAAPLYDASDRETAELPSKPPHDARPVARDGLAEYAHARIPGRGVSIEEPAPLALEAVEQPDGLAQRARQVGDRRVDAHDEIQVVNHCGRVHEVPGFVHAREESALRLAELLGRGALLQADEDRAGNPEQRLQLSKGNASNEIPCEFPVSRPGEADFHPLQSGKSPGPLSM